MWAVANMLKSLDPELANLESGLVPKTFDARFATKAATSVS